jgi:hypothetical protein
MPVQWGCLSVWRLLGALGARAAPFRVVLRHTTGSCGMSDECPYRSVHHGEGVMKGSMRDHPLEGLTYVYFCQRKKEEKKGTCCFFGSVLARPQGRSANSSPLNRFSRYRQNLKPALHVTRNKNKTRTRQGSRLVLGFSQFVLQPLHSLSDRDVMR